MTQRSRYVEGANGRSNRPSPTGMSKPKDESRARTIRRLPVIRNQTPLGGGRGVKRRRPSEGARDEDKMGVGRVGAKRVTHPESTHRMPPTLAKVAHWTSPP